MPVLTGKISDVTGTYIDPSEIVEVVVKAPSPRVSGGSSAAVIVTRTVPVVVGEGGSLSFSMDQGVAVLVVKTFRSQDTYKMVVTEDMTTIREAIIEATGALPELEQSELIELAEQVRQDALFVASERVLVEQAADAAEDFKDEAGTYLAGVQANANAAAVSEGNAEQFADDAEAYSIAASGSATASAGSASSAAVSAGTAGDHRVAAEVARGGAESARSQAESEANRAQSYADDFDLTVTGTSTGVPGSNASVTVSGEGPSYGLTFTIPRGDVGPQGDPGEVTEAMLNAAVASLVDGAPEALDTLDELAAALGNDPNFATTVSTEIGLRAKTADVDAALDGKADATHTHTTGQVTGLDAALAGKADSGAENTATWSGVSGKPSTFPPSAHAHVWGEITGKPSTFAPAAHSHTVGDVTGLQSALDGKAATSHTHTVANVTGLQTALDGKASTSTVSARPALFSGAGAPPSSIPGAVVGDWWLNESTMQLFKITGV